MSAEPPASPEAKLARILAWLHEKFTRNFSVGKDLWELPKTRTKGPIFEQFRSQTAILLANEAVIERLATVGSALRIPLARPPEGVLVNASLPKMAQVPTGLARRFRR
ncbi:MULTISPECIES: hypothetical protein [Rhizobium]|uniref:hypothetical protein n=1 Tax=Rhizobium TaxID=379 RepID=UPI001956CB0F|nr:MULTISPECIES: hypothetical protein [Rhizobium]MBM7044201.1 hypothetical protein [Rhizobium lusitanum]